MGFIVVADLALDRSQTLFNVFRTSGSSHSQAGLTNFALATKLSKKAIKFFIIDD